MRKSASLRLLVASAFALASLPAQARVTVFDAGIHFTVGGYCTPGQVGSSDCAPQALPFNITVGGVTYNSFILNGNGTLTLGTTGIDWSTVADSSPGFGSYPMPVFSPNNDNHTTPVILEDPSGTDINTTWAASVTSVAGTSLTAHWFPCGSTVLCGTFSLPAELSDEVPLIHTVEEMRALQKLGNFGLTITNLGSDSFRLDYFYNDTGDIGTYGFNVPGGPSLQTTGTLVNQSWIFDARGVRAAVPEPATWMLLLLGFGVIGVALRRERRQESRRA